MNNLSLDGLDGMSKDLGDEILRELRREFVDNWEPSEEDVNWFKKTVGSMRVGGRWYIPDDGITFLKVGHDHIKLESIITEDLLRALITLEKLKKVGQKCGVKVDVEKAAEYVSFRIPREN